MKDCVYESQQGNPSQSAGSRFPPFLHLLFNHKNDLIHQYIALFYRAMRKGITEHIFSTEITCITVLHGSHSSCIWN